MINYDRQTGIVSALFAKKPFFVSTATIKKERKTSKFAIENVADLCAVEKHCEKCVCWSALLSLRRVVPFFSALIEKRLTDELNESQWDADMIAPLRRRWATHRTSNQSVDGIRFSRNSVSLHQLQRSISSIIVVSGATCADRISTRSRLKLNSDEARARPISSSKRSCNSTLRCSAHFAFHSCTTFLRRASFERLRAKWLCAKSARGSSNCR